MVGQVGVVLGRQEEELLWTLLELTGLLLTVVELVKLLDKLVSKRGHLELLSVAGKVEAEDTMLHGEQERGVAGLGPGQILLLRAKWEELLTMGLKVKLFNVGKMLEVVG